MSEATVEELFALGRRAQADELFWRGVLDYIDTEHFKNPEKEFMQIVLDYLLSIVNSVEEED